MGCIRDIVDERTTYGYRRVAGMMRVAAMQVGASVVYTWVRQAKADAGQGEPGQATSSELGLDALVALRG